MPGDVLRRTGGVRLSWGDECHFDRARSLPCRMGDGPTRMRDDRGEPCHLECAEQELARLIAGERFGGCSERELIQELTGHQPAVAGQESLTPEVRR